MKGIRCPWGNQVLLNIVFRKSYDKLVYYSVSYLFRRMWLGSTIHKMMSSFVWRCTVHICSPMSKVNLNDLKQRSSTSELRPGTGPWPVGNWIAQAAGKHRKLHLCKRCMHVKSSLLPTPPTLVHRARKVGGRWSKAFWRLERMVKFTILLSDNFFNCQVATLWRG